MSEPILLSAGLGIFTCLHLVVFRVPFVSHVGELLYPQDLDKLKAS